MKLKAGKQVIDTVALAYRADKPVLLEGRHGVGKSQLLEQAAAALRVKCIVRDLSIMEPPDLVGLPREHDGRTVYAPPSFLPDSGKGLLVFEELNRCERYMLSPCLQLLTARCLNDYALPTGWLPVAAINPANDNYDTTELDPALLSRFARIEIEPHVKDWVSWATAGGVHDTVIRYVAQTKDIFDSDNSNPRAWTYVSDTLHAYEQDGSCPQSILLAVIAGHVGDVHARAFLKTYLSPEEPLTLPLVLNDYAKHRATVRKWTKQKRTDMLSATCHNINVAIQNSDTCAEIDGSAAHKKTLADFLDDLPAELSLGLRRSLREKGIVLRKGRR